MLLLRARPHDYSYHRLTSLVMSDRAASAALNLGSVVPRTVRSVLRSDIRPSRCGLREVINRGIDLQTTGHDGFLKNQRPEIYRQTILRGLHQRTMKGASRAAHAFFARVRCALDGALDGTACLKSRFAGRMMLAAWADSRCDRAVRSIARSFPASNCALDLVSGIPRIAAIAPTPTGTLPAYTCRIAHRPHRIGKRQRARGHMGRNTRQMCPATKSGCRPRPEHAPSPRRR